MKNKGFTLVELLAVIVILVIIFGITTVSVFKIKEKQDEKNFENTISSILTAAKEYYVETRNPDLNISVLALKNSVDPDGKVIIKYVDYDDNDKYKNKSYYDYFSSNFVTWDVCTDNNLKKKYSITVKVDGSDITYNDCGCKLNDEVTGTTSDKICK